MSGTAPARGAAASFLALACSVAGAHGGAPGSLGFAPSGPFDPPTAVDAPTGTGFPRVGAVPDLPASVANDDPAGGAAPCPDGQRIVERFTGGAAWDFCWSVRDRDGLVLEAARWTPPGGAPYPVLASGRLAQLHVAYDDGDVTYHDVTQYGLGGTWMQELSFADCPAGRLLEAHGRRVACLSRGHAGGARRSGTASGADERATLFAVSQVGAYTYIVTWHLHADGRLEPVVGASGALQRAGSDTSLPFGRVLSGEPGTSWLSHTHNYHWRLDLDLGAAADDDAFVATEHGLDADGYRPRRSRALDTEEAFTLRPDALQAWHLMEAPPAPGTDPLSGRGYAIGAPGGGHAYERPELEPWSVADLHITVARDCERHATQNARFFPGCADDVGAFVDGESLLGADLVVWKRVSFHHVPRNEDRARMHTHWDGLVLRPVNLGEPVRRVPVRDDPAPPASAVRTGGSGTASTALLAALMLLGAARAGCTGTAGRAQGFPARIATRG